jgi:hypothetical protein
MVTSAFLLWFCCEEGDGSNVVTFLYGNNFIFFLCWCLWFSSLELIFNNKWWFFYLQGMIRSTRCVYARQLKTAWDVKNWDRESNKTSRTKHLVDVLDFHESKMIHGR